MQTPPPPVGARRSRGRASYSHARGPRLADSAFDDRGTAPRRSPLPLPRRIHAAMTDRAKLARASSRHHPPVQRVRLRHIDPPCNRAGLAVAASRTSNSPAASSPPPRVRSAAPCPTCSRSALAMYRSLVTAPTPDAALIGCHSGSDQREPVSVREMMPMARCRLSLRRCRSTKISSWSSLS